MFFDFLISYIEYLALGLFFALPVIFIILCILDVYYKYRIKHLKDKIIFDKIMERKNIVQHALSIVGILEANALIIYLAMAHGSFGFPLIIPIVLFTIAQVMIVKKDYNVYLKKIDIIQLIAIILLIVIGLTFVILGCELSLVNNRHTISHLEGQEAKAHNSSFESYFGIDVTATEVKNLLSEVRTNNLTAPRIEEQTIIGVCYISKNATDDNSHGIYKLELDPAQITRKDLYEILFTSEVETIVDCLKPGTSYTVNVPNTKAFTGDQQGKTGFESDDGGINTLVTGESGGYYSSGYIRLIYIIDNSNRSIDTTNSYTPNNNYNQTQMQNRTENLYNQNSSRETNY